MNRGHWVCILTYVLALAAAAAVVQVGVFEAQPILQLFIADVAATFVVFAASQLVKNASLYDPYWSVAPIAIVGYLAATDGLSWRLLVMGGLVVIWGVRLTGNWLYGWSGLDHEDWRYVRLREKSGAAFFLVNLLGIQLMPTVLVFVGCIPLFFLNSAAPFGALDAAAIFVLALGIYFESVADAQLHRFRARGESGAIINEGLWRLCRHPNYFGEWCIWFGLGIAAAAVGAPWWAILGGPLLMLGLFLGISIPMIEERHLKRRPGYAEATKGLPAFFPFGRRAHHVH